GKRRSTGACSSNANRFSCFSCPPQPPCSSCWRAWSWPGSPTAGCTFRVSTCESIFNAPAPRYSRRRRSTNSVCGICGVIFDAPPQDAEARVKRMTAAMRHRGPDDEGYLLDGERAPGLALGMRRLSIIDLPGGHQPIWNETHDVAAVFNGEIYNYRELRE